MNHYISFFVEAHLNRNTKHKSGELFLCNMEKLKKLAMAAYKNGFLVGYPLEGFFLKQLNIHLSGTLPAPCRKAKQFPWVRDDFLKQRTSG